MMETSTVPSSLLSPRLDAEYYSPKVLPLVKALRDKDHPVLGRLLASMKRHPMCYGFEQWEISGDGRIPYFKGEDLHELSLKHGSSFIQDTHFDDYPSAQVLFGEMIMSVRGTIGRVSVCRNDRGLCSPNTIVLVPKPELDPEFAAAFLSSHHGQILVNREISGTVQDTITEDAIENIQAVRFSEVAQGHIGDKVRQAEQLRAFAKTLQTEAEGFFSLPGMDALRLGEFKAYRAAFSAVDAIRLDPKFYDPGHFKLRELLRPHQPVSIRELASPVGIRWAREEPEFFYLEIGELNLGSGLVKPTRVSTVDAPSRATTLVQPGDVLVSTVRPNRKNVGLVMEVEEPLPIVASSGFSVLRFSSPEEAAFYLFWLRSDAATMQLMRWDAGSSYPAIDESVPLKVLAPHYTEEVVREKGGRWYQSFQAQVLVERLTTAAKLVVEALIEGKVTEAELITAQEALERGDNSADRSLLSRLTRNGLDVPGQPPLFPNLDALYALLAQTREEIQ